MKRQVNKYKIKTKHPKFFWTKCDICNNDFKKEFMWQIKYKDHSICVCKECAPTYKDAEMYAENFPYSKITPLQLPLRSTRNVPSANFKSPGEPHVGSKPNLPRKQNKGAISMKYICKECGNKFDISSKEKVSFVVCPKCGSESIDYNILDPVGNACKSITDKKAKECCCENCTCRGDR